MYNVEIIERLSNLKYVGKLKHYNAAGMSDKKFDENDKVKLFLNISKDGVILNASFKAVGCTGVLVASSFICEMLEDKDLKYARKLDIIAVNRYMGEKYAVIKQHAILVVLNALLNTLKNYDKALSLGGVSYYDKLIEKPKKAPKAKVVKQTSDEKVEKSVKTTTQKSVEKVEQESNVVVEKTEEKKPNKTKSKKKDVSVKVVDDTIIVENVEVDTSSKETAVSSTNEMSVEQSAEKPNKAKSGLLSLLSAKNKKSKESTKTEKESKDITVSVIEKDTTNETKSMKENQISFDFESLGTEKAQKSKKVKAKKEKPEKKNKKAKIINPLATTFDDEESSSVNEDTNALTVVEDNNDVVVEEAVESPVVTKTIRTKTTKKTTKTVVSQVNDSIDMEHTAHVLDTESVEVKTNDETTKKASVEKMNSSLLRLQNLQKKASHEEHSDVVVVESSVEDSSSKEQSLNKLKALVASAKQSKVAESKPAEKPVKATKPSPKTSAPKSKEQPKTQEKSVKYVRIGEFEEKTKKEKKGLFSRIFGRK